MKALITLALAVAFVVAPFVTSPFSGFEADQLPIPQLDPPIQPAGWAFSIWGVIYAGLVISALYGLWKRREDADWQSVRTPLMISLAVGVPWLWIANTSAIWATVTIFVMAGFAIAALLEAPARDRWWLSAPIGLYAGWLTAASFVSLSSTAAGYGLLTDATGWAYIGIAAAAVVAFAVQSRTPEWTYGLAVAWALSAIIVKNWPGLPMVAAAGVALLLIAARAATRVRAPA